MSAVAAPITPGAPVSGTLSPADTTNIYSFSGTAGSTIYLDNTAFSNTGGDGNGGTWTLYDSYGAQVYSNWIPSDSGRLTLPTTGTYTLVVSGGLNVTGTTNYTFNVQPTNDTTISLATDTPVSDSIAVPGQAKNYTVTLAAPTRLFFDSQTNDGNLNWSLTGPQGNLVGGRPFSYDDLVTDLLPAATYTLTINGNGGYTGSYSFNLLDFAAATPITVGTAGTPAGAVVSTTFSPASSDKLYKFTGTAGDNLLFHNLSVSGDPAGWALIDPYGHFVFSNEAQTDASGVQITFNGTYTLIVGGHLSDTFAPSVSFQVNFQSHSTPGSLGTPIGLGTPVSDVVPVGGVANYQFTLGTATRLWFDSQTYDGSLNWSLSGPTGNVISGANFTWDDQNLGLLPAGTYLLQVSGPGGEAYAFSMLSFAAATPITQGTAVTGSLNPANSTQLYSFSGTAGTTIYLDSTGVTPNDPNNGSTGNWTLYDSYGVQVYNGQMQSDSGRLTLPTTGTYTLVVHGYTYASSSFTTDFAFTVRPVTDATAALTLGTAVSGSIASQGQQKNYTFTLASPAQIWFDSRTSDGNLYWSMSGPQGNVYGGTPFSYDDRNVGILPAGTYTLTVAANGDYTGSFAFNLLSSAGATSITTGSAVTATLNPANSTNLYKFSGTAGSTIFLDSTGFTTTDPNGYGGSWTLYDAYGTQVYGNYFGYDSGRITLPTTGTYTLAVQGYIYANGTTTDNFVVRSVTDATAALTLGTAVSGSIASQGQQKNYTFTLASPTRLWFDSQTNDGNFYWTIKGSQGTVNGNTAFSSDDQNIGLLPAGSYTLTVGASSDYTGSFKFNLLDLAAATSITVGTSGTPTGQTVSATLSPANSTKLYKFSGTAGDTFLFHNLSYTGDYANWRLLDPYNNSIFGSYLGSDNSGVTLPASGTYTLAVYANVGDTTAPNYSFQVNYQSHTNPPTISGTTLTLGSPVSTSVSAGGIDYYQFTLANPTRLWFDVQTYDGSLSWSLAGPQGTVLGYENFNWDDQNIGLLPAGTYSLQVSGPGGEAYAFNLLSFTAATPITPGSPVSGTLNPSNSTKLYSFSGTAGTTIFLDSASATPNDPNNGNTGHWTLYDGFGTQVFDGAFQNDSGRLTLPTTGTYTLALHGYYYASPTYTTDYSFTVRSVSDATTALTLGTAVSGSIAGQGQQKNYTFTLASPTQLWFDSQTNDGNLNWVINGSQGNVYGQTPFSYDDRTTAVLPAGTYTLTIAASGDYTGSYNFNLLSFAAATSVSLNSTVNATLNPADSTNLYKFSGTAGSTIYLDNTAFSTSDPNNYSGYWTLFDAYGTQVYSNNFIYDSGRITLPTTGTYTLGIQGYLNATGSATDTFVVRSISDATTAMTLGTPVSGSIATPGQQQKYTFTLGGSVQLWFDSRTSDGNLYWTLSGPQGNVYGGTPFSYDDRNIGIVPAGTYTLTVSGNGDYTGSYGFNVFYLSSSSVLTTNSAVTASLSPANSAKSYKFAGTAGSTLYLDNTAFSTTDPNGYRGTWYLYDAYGTQVFAGDLINDSGRVTLPTTGTYTVVFAGSVNATGTASDTFVVRTVSDATVALTLGTAVSGSITGAGQKRNYTFTLASPTYLWFDTQTNDGNLYWTLNGPQGNVYGNTGFSSDERNIGYLPAGSYTLTVAGNYDYTGSYKFNLLDFAAATPITVGSVGTPTGQTVSATLNPANSTKLYNFTGSSGDKFLFHNLSYSGDNAYWQLLDPYNNLVFSNYFGSDASGVTLALSGTYTLAVFGSVGDTNAPSYSFQVNFQSHYDPNSLGTPIALGTPVTGAVGAGGVDPYQFSLASPTRLWFDSLTYDGSLTWSLVGPQGTIWDSRNFAWDDQAIGLLAAGTYVLKVSGPGGEAYAFNILDFAAATPVTLGSPVSASLNPANSTNLYSFSGTAGSTIFLDNTAFSSSDPNGYTGYWSLIDAFGNQVFNSNFTNDSGRITLPTTGTYTLAVQGYIPASGAATDTFVVRTVNDSTTALTLGTAVSGSIASPGQQSNYTFTLASPTQLWFDSQANDGNLNWVINGSQGNVYGQTPFNYDDRATSLLPAGTYTLTVAAYGDYIGGFNFNLLSFAGAVNLSLNSAVTTPLSPANSTTLYKFAGTAGSTIFLDATGFSTSDPNGYRGSWYLYDAYGTQVFSSDLANDSGRITLPTSGTYTLAVQGHLYASGSATDSFVVRSVSDATTALTLGTPVSGSIATPGQQQKYTFTLGGPNQLWFDSRTNDGNLNWTLTGPQGVVFGNTPFSYDDRLTSLLPAATYTLTVSGNGDYTGSFAFNLFYFSSSSVLTTNSAVTASLSPANSAKSYKFAGTAGSTLYLDNTA
ncbi:hypothetical protein ACYOEI_05520, partial [Singulisphaera rosea]